MAEQARLADVEPEGSPLRRAGLLAFGSAVFWLLVGSVLGDLASLKFQFPDLLASPASFTFGRVRPAHLNAMIYGWASLSMLGTALWLVPRLVHVPLRWGRLARLGLVLWNVGLVIGVPGILLGYTDGLEMHRYLADPWLVVGGGLVGASILRTVLATRVRHLYVSIWYVASAFVWFPIIYLTGNAPGASGVESAAINWFYAHNALGFWLTAIGLGAAYYFIPKVLGRPIYSYQLSLLGFWALAFFYALNGMHHVIGGPLPSWMIATSLVASFMMVIPVAAVAVNHHMSMVGRFGALRYSPTLRFVVVGAISYTAVSLQGVFQSMVKVNRVTHFTHWTIAHAHVGVYAFATFILFGSAYYILPRLVGREWPSARLISWHFWLVLSGIALYVVPLTVGGVLQGLALSDPNVPFRASVDVVRPYLAIRTIAGFVLSAGHVVFAWSFVRLLRAAPAREVERRVFVRPIRVDFAEEREAAS
mgnify:CR=1 FL=1